MVLKAQTIHSLLCKIDEVPHWDSVVFTPRLPREAQKAPEHFQVTFQDPGFHAAEEKTEKNYL